MSWPLGGWLPTCLVGWLAAGSADWLPDVCLSVWLAGWLGWVAGWLAWLAWPASWLPSWLAGGWLPGWRCHLAGWPTVCLVCLSAELASCWLTSWLPRWLSRWLSVCGLISNIIISQSRDDLK